MQRKLEKFNKIKKLRMQNILYHVHNSTLCAIQLYISSECTYYIYIKDWGLRTQCRLRKFGLIYSQNYH